MRQDMQTLWSPPRSPLWLHPVLWQFPAPRSSGPCFYWWLPILNFIRYLFFISRFMYSLFDSFTWIFQRQLNLSKTKTNALFIRICSHSFVPVSMNDTSILLVAKIEIWVASSTLALTFQSPNLVYSYLLNTVQIHSCFPSLTAAPSSRLPSALTSISTRAFWCVLQNSVFHFLMYFSQRILSKYF